MRIKRQKQEPFFSALEEIDLNILAREAKKEDPSEEVLTEAAEPIVVRTSTAAADDIVIEPPSEQFQISEIQILEKEKAKENFPSEQFLNKPVFEPIVARPSTAVVAEPLPKLSRKTGISMGDAPFVYISPGTFIMGSPEHEPGRGSDEMQHEVTLTKGYFIQTTPVTQEQWKEVMGGNPSNFLQEGEVCPVEQVSFNDCQEFLRRVNHKGRNLYRLPTEAEWEYACRAGASTAFFNGEITRKLFWRLDPCLDAIGWYSGNSKKKTHPVAEKQPNAWGLFDMHGNVCEWCQDWYGEYPMKPRSDPQGVTLGLGCVARGGSWISKSRDCRAAGRFCYSPNLRSNFVGFRLVREP